MYKLQPNCFTLIDGNIQTGANWFVKDLDDRADRIKHLEFHIEHGDYFAVLATIINIANKEKDFNSEKIFRHLFEDLEYLQENYDIIRKKRE